MHYAESSHRAGPPKDDAQPVRQRNVRGFPSDALLILFVVLGVGVFYLLTIRDGHDWGGDFAMYLQHARNIASGRPYTGTPFVYDPHVSEPVGPAAYPPVFPLILAALPDGGSDLWIEKASVVAFFMLFLFAVGGVLRRRLPVEQVLLILLVLGLSPWFWNQKDHVLSDIPFAFFVYLALWLADIESPAESSRARSVGVALLVGAVVYVATATRALGIALVPTLVFFEALKYRRLPVLSVLSTLVVVALMVIQRAVLGGTGEYMAMVSVGLERVIINALNYAFSFKHLFWNGYVNGIAVAIWLIFLLLAIYGYRQRIRAGLTILEVFAVVYIVPLLLWPWYQGIRFLIPLTPLYLYYAVVGFTELRTRMTWRLARRIAIGLALLIFGSFGAAYTHVDYREIRGGVSEPEAVQLFEYVRANRRTTDVYVFFKPRVLAYYTGARTAALHQPEDRAQLWSYYERVGATHVIVRKGDQYLEDVVRASPGRFTEVYRNSGFVVYERRNDR